MAEIECSFKIQTRPKAFINPDVEYRIFTFKDTKSNYQFQIEITGDWSFQDSIGILIERLSHQYKKLLNDN